MRDSVKILAAVLALLGITGKALAQQQPQLFSVKEMQEDFAEMRRLLESEHCCLYEYTGKSTLDSIFDHRATLIDRPMSPHEFFGIIAPIAAKIGCMHTMVWMSGSALSEGGDNLFPLQLEIMEGSLVVTGSYRDTADVPIGSIILEINGRSAKDVLDDLRTVTSADAFNPHFVDAQIEKRFAMFYASMFGFPESYRVTYALPGRKTQLTAELHPASITQVRDVVFANFRHPPLTLDVLKDAFTAVMTVKTFIYYDRVEYFRGFMDSCFALLKERAIRNLILDLRGNDGGDPFCAVILYSYLEQEPAPYFAEPYGRYAELADPVPPAENRFTGTLITLIDGGCASTNGHFCALLKYRRIGTFVGTPSGATYKCNAGKDTEFRLRNTSLILTLGRTTFAAAVEGMEKKEPISPDVLVRETVAALREGRDPYMDAAVQQIERSSR